MYACVRMRVYTFLIQRYEVLSNKDVYCTSVNTPYIYHKLSPKITPCHKVKPRKFIQRDSYKSNKYYFESPVKKKKRPHNQSLPLMLIQRRGLEKKKNKCAFPMITDLIFIKSKFKCRQLVNDNLH